MLKTFGTKLIAVLLLSGGFVSACQPSTAQRGKVVSSGTAEIGGAYTLVNQDGEAVTEQDYMGAPQMIYFGFTYCPDICPTALMQMGAAQERLGKDGRGVQYLFISVDPERDTPESLKPYVGANGFPEGLIGLTGTQEQIDTVKAAYKVYSAKVEDPESTAPYTVDHSSIIYFMDEKGELVDFFTHTSNVNDIVARVRLHQNDKT